jgi:hypothetical protein
MSGIPARDPIDLRAILARIDRDLEEGAKLRDEATKLRAEERKLISESRKLDRDRWLAPLVLAASLLGGLLAVALSHLWR